MAERPVPELSPAARELLGAFRAAEGPGPGVRRQHWVELQERLDAPSAGPSLDRGRYYAKVVGVTMALAAGLLLAVKVVGLGVSALSTSAREPAMEAPYQGGAEAEGGQAVEREGGRSTTRRAEARRPGAAEPEAALAPSEPEPSLEAAAAGGAAEGGTAAVERPAPRAARSRATAGASAPEPASATSDLTAELALIKEATLAKQGGRIEAGLAALQRHAQRFPSGTLADERRVLRAELLCVAGRRDEARAEARAFLRQHAGSALSGRMRRACPEGG